MKLLLDSNLSHRLARSATWPLSVKLTRDRGRGATVLREVGAPRVRSWRPAQGRCLHSFACIGPAGRVVLLRVEAGQVSNGDRSGVLVLPELRRPSRRDTTKITKLVPQRSTAPTLHPQIHIVILKQP